MVFSTLKEEDGFMKKSFVMMIVLVVMQLGCDLATNSNKDSSGIEGTWTFATGADVKTGIIYHNSSAYTSKHADTTFIATDLSGSTINFASGGTITMSVPFFTSNLTLNGTWTYSASDSNVTMKVQGSSVWPNNKTGKLAIVNNIATITYAVSADTLSHGTSTFGTKSDTTSDVFIGTEVIKMTK
jgi:hypothetical protein